uniref:C-type lectin domain-containing protein n=1 Tax=Salarias fasciatus TaxID=181472 RepID=A0A672J4V0_SALFA
MGQDSCGTPTTKGRAPPASQDGSVIYNLAMKDFEYLYVSESLSWHEAQAYCRKHHTDLASIQSEEEYEVVKNKVPSGHVLAIGLHRELSDNWSDGVQRKFRNWLPGHPSLKSGSCVTTLINRENPGKWIENSCNKKFPFICRKGE